MAHKHQVYDTDLHFTIDKITRRISSTSGKVILMQNDHNSERFTFELDRYVEGHDMMLCDRVEVHYINIDSANKRNKTEDVYEVLDLQLSPEDENVVILSWLISQNATMYAGTLSFLIRFACTADDEERTIEYQWFTDIYALISIAKGIYNSDVVTDDGDPDILAQWKQQIMDLAQPYVDSSANSAAAAAMSEANAAKSETNAAISEANAKESEQYAAASETNAKISETNAAKSETNAAKSEANAKASEEYAAEYADKADNLNAETLETLQQVSESVAEYDARIGNTSFTVNLETGELEYESPDYIFYVNEETGNLEWETLHEHSGTAETIIHTVRNEKSDAVVQSAAGTYFVVEDSSDDPLRGLKLFGRTEQFTTTGAQLAYMRDTLPQPAGLTLAYTDNGNLLVNGTAENDLWVSIYDVTLTAGTRYTVSGDASITLAIWDAVANSNLTSLSVGDGFTTFTPVSTGRHALCMQNVAGSAFNNVTANIMVCEGTEALPWEPYTGGVASPNPNYPQKVERVGSENEPINVRVAGINLLPFDDEYFTAKMGLKCSTDSDGGLIVTGTTPVAYASAYSVQEFKLPPGTYTISGGDAGAGHVYAQAAIKGADGTTTYCVNRTFTIDGTEQNIALSIQCGNYIGEVDDIIHPMLCVGSTVPAWEAPRETQVLNVAFENGLLAIPVTTGGNFTDANGQQWICDEVDFERGVYVQRIYEEVITVTRQEYSNKYGYRYAGMLSRIAGSDRCLSSMGVYSDYAAASVSNSDDGVRISASSGYVTFLLETKSESDTIDVDAVYILATPLEHTLSKEELAAFKSLHTNYPTTTVFNDSDVHMELKYNADTKNYIAAEHVKMEAAFDAKLEELKALISAQT